MRTFRTRRVGSGKSRRDCRGQAQVEFILTIVFVLVLIFGIFELFMLIYTTNVLADAAKEGVRYAVVHGSNTTNPGTASTGTCSANSGSSTPSSVVGQVCNFAALSFHDVSGMTVTVTYPDGGTSNAAPNRVQVQVSYAYAPFMALGWEAAVINLGAAAEGRIFI